MPGRALLVQIDAVRDELDQAAEALFVAAEDGLAQVAAARAGDAAALDAIEAALMRVIEGCAFQDLTGQRLTRIATQISEGAIGACEDDRSGLLNGPALPGLGLDQSAADALFNAR